MPLNSPAVTGSPSVPARLRAWLRGRPGTAALLVAVAGAELGYLPLGRPELLGFQGVGGTSSLLIAAALLTVAVALLYRPRRAQLGGGAAMLLGLLSCPMANLGGFLLGMVLAVLGGALAMSWRPRQCAAAAGEGAPPEAASGNGPAVVAGSDDSAEPGGSVTRPTAAGTAG